MVKTTCHRCGHEWDYSGDSDHYCSCPTCRTSVKVGREPDSEDSESEEAPEGSPQEAPQEATQSAQADMGEPTVVIDTGGVQRDLPVTEAVKELYERQTDLGGAHEAHRQRQDDLAEEVAQLGEQIEEVASILKAVVEVAGGEADYETLDVEAAEEGESGDDAADDAAIPEVLRNADADAYDPTEEFEDE